MKVKSFLQKNKIYFETVMSIFVSFAAISISIASCIITKQQVKISENEQLPKFTISAHQEKSGNNGDIYDQDNIYIQNNGGYFRQFSVKCVTKVLVEKYNKSSFTQKKVEKYLWNYYDGTAYSSGDIKAPAKIVGFKNNMDFINIKRAFRELAEKENCYGDMDIQRYIRISYIDTFDRLHIQYFNTQLIFGSIEIDKITGEKIFIENDNVENKIDFMNADAELFNRLITF